MIFLGLKFWPKDWVYERRRDFWDRVKKEGFFGVAKKALRDLFGYAKTSRDFLG